MIRIVTNVKCQDVVHSCSLDVSFPVIEGKLISVEVNGKELRRLAAAQELPLCSVDNISLTWHGRYAGRIVKVLRELSAMV